MKRLKCSQCGLVNRIDAAACLRCKATLDQSDSATEETTVSFVNDSSAAIQHKPTRLKSYWSTVVEQRYLVALTIGVVVVALLLNQTQTVSSWFVPKEIAAILENLDQRTKAETSGKLVETRNRVKALAVHASRGRISAIRELVNLDVATTGMSVPNPATREQEKLGDIQRALGPRGVDVDGIPISYEDAENLRQITFDPGITGSYLQRGASIEEYVSDILANVGEPAVDPILERIRAIRDRQRSGDTTMAAEIPRGLLMALGRIKSPRALDLLITCATSKPYSYNNIKAIEALSFYEKADPRLFEIYDMALTEAKTPTDQAKTFNSPYAIRVASDGLARIKSDASLQILITHLDLGKWENGPTYLVKAIERFGKPAVPAVLDLVRNTSASQFARQNAVQALGLLRASETRSDVIALLDSPDLHQPAAQALATWGKMDTIPDLQAAMQRHPEWGWDFDNAIQRIKR